MATSPWEDECTQFDKLTGFHYDVNGEGDEFPRGARCVLESTMRLASHHVAAPWGFGASLFVLGANEDLLARLLQEPATFGTVAQAAISAAKFKGRLARGCRIQLGVQHREDRPLREAREIPTLVLAVWGHDAGFSSELRERLQLRDAEYTLGDFANSGEIRRACDAGTRLRQQLARAVLDTLAFPPPRGLMTDDPTVIAFRVDSPSFTMVHQPAIGGTRGEHVTCYLDAAEVHAGSQGAGVYYSAAAGSCFYESPRTRVRPTHPRGGTIGLVPGSTGFTHGTGPLVAIQSPPGAASADITVLAADDGGLTRVYLSVDTDESDRLISCGDNGALAQTNGARLRVRPVATAITGPFSESSDLLYGRIPMDTVANVLKYTSAAQRNVEFANTPEWVTRLTVLAPGGRVWDLLNERSAINNEDGVITSYAIDRSMIEK